MEQKKSLYIFVLLDEMTQSVDFDVMMTDPDQEKDTEKSSYDAFMEKVEDFLQRHFHSHTSSFLSHSQEVASILTNPDETVLKEIVNNQELPTKLLGEEVTVEGLRMKIAEMVNLSMLFHTMGSSRSIENIRKSMPEERVIGILKKVHGIMQVNLHGNFKMIICKITVS